MVHYIGFKQLKVPPLPFPFQVCITKYCGWQVPVAYFQALISTYVFICSPDQYDPETKRQSMNWKTHEKTAQLTLACF